MSFKDRFSTYSGNNLDLICSWTPGKETVQLYFQDLPMAVSLHMPFEQVKPLPLRLAILHVSYQFGNALSTPRIPVTFTGRG